MAIFHIAAYGNGEAPDGGIQKAFHRGIEAVAVNMQYRPFHKPSSKTPPVKYSIAPKVAFSQQVFYGNFPGKNTYFGGKEGGREESERPRRDEKPADLGWISKHQKKQGGQPDSIPS